MWLKKTNPSKYYRLSIAVLEAQLLWQNYIKIRFSVQKAQILMRYFIRDWIIGESWHGDQKEQGARLQINKSLPLPFCSTQGYSQPVQGAKFSVLKERFNLFPWKNCSQLCVSTKIVLFSEQVWKWSIPVISAQVNLKRKLGNLEVAEVGAWLTEKLHTE